MALLTVAFKTPWNMGRPVVAQGRNWPDTDILPSVGRKAVVSPEVSAVRTRHRGLGSETALMQSLADESVRFQSPS